MASRETETQTYIHRRIRHALTVHAYERISKILEQIEANDKKARTAVYIFALLFAIIAIAQYLLITHTRV